MHIVVGIMECDSIYINFLSEANEINENKYWLDTAFNVLLAFQWIQLNVLSIAKRKKITANLYETACCMHSIPFMVYTEPTNIAEKK